MKVSFVVDPGVVLTPILQDAGHEVVGLDTNLFDGCGLELDDETLDRLARDGELDAYKHSGFWRRLNARGNLSSGFGVLQPPLGSNLLPESDLQRR